MKPTFSTEINNKVGTESSFKIIPQKFRELMADDDCEEDKEPVLMDGPVVAQLAPIQTPVPFSKLIENLPTELISLIEPLPTEIEIQQKSGVMQTKLTIELPSFEMVEVIIDQYDTAPQSFHISFFGSEQTGALISQKQRELVLALQAALPNFSFAISPPFLDAPVFSLPKSKRLSYSPVKKGNSKK